MTTISTKYAKCPICEAELRYSVLASTNAFGSMDLDMRPPEMQRSTMCYWLTECPECGYISNDMENEAPINRSFVDSSAYKNCDGYSFTNNLSEGFYRHYMIMKSAGRSLDACFELLHTAWACDDKEDENAIEIRKTLADDLKRLLEEEYDENLDAVRMDALRRSGQFDLLIEEYKEKVFDTDIINTIRDYQVLKSRAKDTACYTVMEAIEHFENNEV